jgi:NAD(P)-dependent dehydrogenase (short-subunit alcohol dehydrogenase family)
VGLKHTHFDRGETMEIKGKVAVVTGAASGIGQAVAVELVARKARAIALVDQSPALDETERLVRQLGNGAVIDRYVGDVGVADFRREVFDRITTAHGVVQICVPAAGITRDALAVKIDKQSGQATIYPLDDFRKIVEINLIAPIYWALEMVARIALDRRALGLKRWEPPEHIQGTIIFIGSVSSSGNKGQIAYSATKRGLEGAAGTLMKEAMFHGVRCGVIHPGYTDTPMVQALGEDYVREHILPQTQLRRLIAPGEIADAICFMINNSAVSGELWADAGWHPSV